MAENQNRLHGCGLPDIVRETEEHWWGFLEHGYLDHHFDTSNFGIELLSSDKKEILYHFLSEELSASDKESALVFKELKSEFSKS